MTEQKQFASSYPRNEEDWILFPRDDGYRKDIFKYWDRLGISLSSHPAKANIYLVQACVEYVSEIGETVMDIMSGTGTIMIAALIGRRVICIELEEYYQNLIQEGIKDIEAIAPGAEDMITLVAGDCALVLPLPVDHIIFSPPYAQIMRHDNITSGLDKDIWDAGDGTYGITHYAKSPGNVGNINEFFYHRKMETIYKKCLQSLRIGGTLTIIIKDHFERGNRIYLGDRAARDCMAAGFELADRFKWKPPGSAYLGIRKGKGEEIVEDEDIIILRRTR